MPCTLISGLPGNGKTLRCLWLVERLRRESGRPVYFFDIRRRPGQLVEWIPLGDESTFGRRKEGIEPDKSQVLRWYEIVPEGAIVVIDECWSVFPKRGPASQVPRHVEELATHRHRGIDLFLMSQHAANQVDHFVRGLIQIHEHCVRLFGLEKARIHRWTQGLGNPEDYHSRQQSETEIWTFPREVYGWYVSAEVHTIKRQVPWKVVGMIGGGALAVALLAWLGYSSLFATPARVSKVTEDAGKALERQGSISRSGGDLEQFKPLTAMVPFTAPFYTEAVQVKSVPRITGCGSLKYGDGRIDCWCNSQQGTLIEVDTRTCLRLVESGSFDWGLPDEDVYRKFEPHMAELAEPEEPYQWPEKSRSATSAPEVAM